MSAILAFAGLSADTFHETEVSSLLASMSHRGSEKTALWRSSGALLAVARDHWEMEPGVAGPVLVASLEPFHVVCDATLYYKAELEARVRGAGTVESGSPATLIAQAYAALGTQCVQHLEGDFAFCVWDERNHTLFCARDPFGTRSLFYLESDGGLLVASTPHPLVKRLGPRAAFDAEGVLRSLLMRHGDGTRTAWKGVRELPAGHLLQAGPGGLTTNSCWTARGSDNWRRLTSGDAVQAFSNLLTNAAKERGQADGTSLAMSGGQDSTAVLASLHPNSSTLGRGPHILSFKFPEGDPGNEDWYVDLVADSFRLGVHWVDTAEVGLFDGAGARARRRSNCHGHIFEGHNRALARTARRLESRILLNGHGGDNLCGVGDWLMADLLRSGQWRRLRRFLTDRGYRGLRAFLTYCVRPALPFWVFDRIEPLLGRQICSRPYERPVPQWVVAERSLLARITKEDRGFFDRSIVRHHSTISDQRRAWALMDSGFTRACAALFDLTRDEGVELRMPFYDLRLVEFVMSRPAEEFNQPGRNKVLLRRAMEGRLPDRTRNPQPGGLKPGTAVGLMESRWAPEVSAFVKGMSDGPWISEELGVVDRQRFAAAVSNVSGLERSSTVDLSLTPLIEAWLRAQIGPG